MTPQHFLRKWQGTEIGERQAAQSHFIDLCHLLGQPTPTDADPKGEWYCFEKGASKVGGGEGWADVWKREFFGWEYKGKGRNLDAAFAQLQRYAPALENPPLLIVSDMDRIRVHTNWTNTVPKVYEVPLNRIAEPESLYVLRSAFTDPEKLKPDVTREQVTKEAASKFAQLAQRLRDRGEEAHRVAHFLNRMMFCLFAEDADLLPSKLFTRALVTSKRHPEQTAGMLRQLFGAMHRGGLFGAEVIEWFNGGLFDSDDAVNLRSADVDDILEVSKLDWSSVEPSIFGTLFERGLDPSKRSQLGAHYTDPQSIMRIVNPVVVEPLNEEWRTVRDKITDALRKASDAKAQSTRNKASKEAEQLYQGFLHRLSNYRVLDPACGSGNFLYLALQALKDIEHRTSLEAEQLGLQRGFVGMNTGVHNVRGIEVNGYAAELARVTVWIGEIQWMLRHGVPPSKDPILKPLDTIECRDAILNDDATEAVWPEADAIVGNPPFLGGKLLRANLSDAYVNSMFKAYFGRVPAEADLVVYWFEKARCQLVDGRATSAGLVATNSIRGGANRRVLERIETDAAIFDAWSDENWVNEGAAVRVSLICFRRHFQGTRRLDDKAVPEIHADLTAGINATHAKPLRESTGVAFMGDTKGGAFDIDGDTARKWLVTGGNSNRRPNSDVLRPWINGLDVTRRPRDMWIIDFGWQMNESEAAHYSSPFEHVANVVRPERSTNARAQYRLLWWRHVEARQGMCASLVQKARYIATPRVAKHRLFVWMDRRVLPDSQIIAIALDDDASFGVLHSRFHQVWSLRLGTSLEDRPRYTPTTTFETFPFPVGLEPATRANSISNTYALQVAQAAIALSDERELWLNPPEWTSRVPEVVAGYPDRLVVKQGHESELKGRTLTNLYNAMPTWLRNAHRELDAAVALAYGWTDYTPEMPEDEILRRLLNLNLSRAT